MLFLLTHVHRVLQVGKTCPSVNNNHVQRSVKNSLTSTEMYWQVVLAALTQVGYLETIMILYCCL